MIKKTSILIAILSLCIVIFVYFFIQKKHTPLHKIFAPPTPSLRKTILVFTSSGGRGHISATEALEEYLGDTYEIKPVYVIRDVLDDLDFIANITHGAYHSEELYNYFLVRKQASFIKPMVWVGKLFFTMHKHAIEKLLEQYIEVVSPAMIISVIPIVNGVTAKIAEKKKIPFWIIPTDCDASLFMYQVSQPQSPLFFVNCFLNKKIIKKTLQHSLLKPQQYTYVGMPVRPQFLKTYDQNSIKQKHLVPLNKPVIMVMMGGRGTQDTIRLAKQLFQLQKPVHLLLCIGNQVDLIESLKMLPCAETVTFSIIEFTHNIAELMAISDLFITKSGGQSVSEALYMKLPMLIDATSPALDWEQLNRTFIENN